MAEVTFIKDEEHKIIIRTIVGEATAQEIVDTFQTIANMINDGFKAIGIINDVTNGKLNISIKEISKIVSFLKKNNHIFSNMKIAACVTSPSAITIPLLVASQATKVKIKPFSTIDAAYVWILSYS